MSYHKDFWKSSKTNNGKVLDLGCGFDKKIPSAIGVDIIPTLCTDVVCNLDNYPLPFKDNTFDLIICSHIIEHITDVVKFMNEIHRIAKPGAIVKGMTPHFSSPYSFADPTHKHHFTYRTFDFFSLNLDKDWSKPRRIINKIMGCDPMLHRGNIENKFIKKQVRFVFRKVFRILGISYLANKFPELYESYLCGIFKTRDMFFELEVIKDQ